MELIKQLSSYSQVAQAKPATEPDFSNLSIEERSALVEAAKKKLDQVKHKVDSLITKASDLLKKKLNEAKRKAEELTDKLTAGAHHITEKIYKSVKKVLDTVSRLEQLVQEEAEKATKAINDYEVNRRRRAIAFGQWFVWRIGRPPYETSCIPVHRLLQTNLYIWITSEWFPR